MNRTWSQRRAERIAALQANPNAPKWKWRPRSKRKPKPKPKKREPEPLEQEAMGEPGPFEQAAMGMAFDRGLRQPKSRPICSLEVES